MITENLSTLKIHKLTQEQYENALSNGTIDENALYLTPDEEIDLSPYATVEQLNTKADTEHTHEIADVNNLQTSLDQLLESAKGYTDNKVAGKADKDHNHDDLYYTTGEVDSLLLGKSDTSHNHDSAYDKKGTADTSVSTHNTATDAHNDIRELITDLNTKVTNFLDVDDTTKDQLSEVITLIENNKGTLESLTTSKVNVSDIIDNLTTASANKVLSANQGVAIKSLIDGLQKALDEHKHTVSEITDLTATAAELNTLDGIDANVTELNHLKGVTSNVQTQLNGKADKEHNHDDMYYTEGEIDTKLDEVNESIANKTPLKVTLTAGANSVLANPVVTISADKTFAEIVEAYDNGRTIYAVSDYIVMPLVGITHQDGSGYAVFYLQNRLNAMQASCSSQNGEDVWTYETSYVVASQDDFGGIKAAPKTDEDTIPARIGSNGMLYVAQKDQLQSDWTETDPSNVSYIQNKPKISQDSIILKDQVNDYEYVIQMRNGNLVSTIAVSNIYVTNFPNKTSYMMGEYFDPAGMIVTAVCQDGSTKVIENYTCTQSYLTTSDTSAEITYNEAGVIHTTTVLVTVTEFDAASVLVDFEYTAEDDGTYTLTSWNGTLNGQPSTEMVIPSNGLINVDVG